MREIILVVAAKLRECQYGCQRTPAPPGASCSLLVVSDGWGHVPHAHAQKATNVDPHLHRRCDRKHVDTIIVRVLMIMKEILEPTLFVACFYDFNLVCFFCRLKCIGIIKRG